MPAFFSPKSEVNKDQGLFEKNMQMFLSNAQITESDYSISDAIELRDASDREKELNHWFKSEYKCLTLPFYSIRSESYQEEIEKICSKYNLGSDVLQYYDVPGDDPQLYQGLLKIRNGIKQCGVDPDDVESHPSPHTSTLVAVGCGNGQLLAQLIQDLQPPHLVVAVQSWNHFISSFWHLDWIKINEHFSQPNKKISLVRVKTVDQLRSTLAEYSMLGLEHTVLYDPLTKNGFNDEYLKELGNVKLGNMFQYLGFTLDEYNMVLNTADTLACCPRLFSTPTGKVNKPFIVCGSGPSLDKSIDALKKLSDSHIIIASGSNYQTLVHHGIEPDYLTLNERANNTYDDYLETYQEYGRTKTKLLMSSTCPHQLIPLFDECAVFFRPALTPLALFSTESGQVLGFEGPEAVNTGVSFAAHVGASSIILVGVDLGCKEKDNLRSKHASGNTPRVMDRSLPGNFGGKVLSSKPLLDVCIMIEETIIAFDAIKFFNASDGLKIKGANPLDIYEYLDKSEFLIEESSLNLEDWWSSLQRYSPSLLAALWKARLPREEISNLTNQLKSLFLGESIWFSEVQNELDQLLTLGVNVKQQFPRRLYRSTIYKLALCVTQQFYIMRKHEEDKQIKFGSLARQVLSDTLDILESESYSLCDEVEARIKSSGKS